jgi:AcrR family transcriptional regulator
VTRWDPGAQDRLRQAALDLYLAHGFESVTVTEIAERAGLTRRTFFRYFADKREVLFAGSERIPGAVIEAVHDADEGLSPLEAALQALTVIGTRLGDYADRTGERRAVIAASPELQERERTKLAAISAALATGLRQRGADEASARLLAPVAGAIFATAFERWIDHADREFAEIFYEAVTEVRSALAGQ